MGATKRVVPVQAELEARREKSPIPAPVLVPVPDLPPAPARVPALRVTPLLAPGRPRQFVRVPTHAVGVDREQREYPRASLRLPLRLRSVNGVPEDFPVTLVTRDISSTGVFFLCPKQIAVSLGIELEIVLVQRPMGRGNVVIVTQAQVQRIEPAATPGWHGIAASFTDVQFDRDDCVPSRFIGR
jgi:PilZ domain